MTTRGARTHSLLGRFTAPGVWAAVALAAGAAMGAPADTDPGLSPVSLTISDFAALDRGGPIETGMAVLGVTSFALSAVARRWLPTMRGLPTVLLAVWGLGLVVAAVIPTDPLATHLSGPALVHRYASITAFVALPLSGLVMARRLSPAPDALRTVRGLRLLSGAAVAGALVMALAAGPGNRELIGLAERLLLACEAALLGVLAHHVQHHIRFTTPPDLGPRPSGIGGKPGEA
ncbi:DUF998 domain-containing protein [Streptomyces sp. NPDC047123]|uniref:DUF998 domain-containing protein n=1 Tax=Streptomyces sp. NPDC047123 TaxID=3155622 RepID=UPI0033E5EB3B